MSGSETCLLLRTRRFGPREQDFLGTLARQSGYAVAVAADEANGSVDCGEFRKVSVTRRAAARLGLFCPRDFAWRCGDYSLYLARQTMPDVTHFWQIEPDVRATFADWGEVFRPFDAHPNVDLIGFNLRPSDPEYFWYPTMLHKTPHVYRCLFALTRFSARALDACRAARQRDTFNGWARVLWPNDEIFTTTTLVAAGFDARDANSFGRMLYTRQTFGFDDVWRGQTFDATAERGLLYHPVLWGEDYDRKVARTQRGTPRHERVRLRLLRAAAHRSAARRVTA